MHWQLETIGLAVLLCVAFFSLFTNAISKTILTLPILFTGLGYLVSHHVNTLAEPEALTTGTRLLAEVTLVLVLFSDASRLQVMQLRKNYKIPVRMLVIGLPLTLLCGALTALMIIPSSGIAMALLTAAVLAPTDAALGQSVVTSAHVPNRLRQAINVESGLNDGLALPFVLFAAMLTSSGAEAIQSGDFAIAIALQLVLGPFVGVLFGWGLAKVMEFALARNLMAEAASGVVFVSSALTAYLGAELVGGNGFIAAFCAGVTFGNCYKHDIHFIGEFMEGIGQILTMIAFLIFGAILLPAGLVHMQWQAVALGIMFLTVVRMLPIWLSLLGTGLATREKLFLGWFGPRGLASILFTMIMTDEFDFRGEAELMACVSMTVFLSIILHGISSAPLAEWIGKRSTDTKAKV
ncbi:MAG: cation:proton antiporter [Sulfitobacter sp.]